MKRSEIRVGIVQQSRITLTLHPGYGKGRLADEAQALMKRMAL